MDEKNVQFDNPNLQSADSEASKQDDITNNEENFSEVLVYLNIFILVTTIILFIYNITKILVWSGIAENEESAQGWVTILAVVFIGIIAVFSERINNIINNWNNSNKLKYAFYKLINTGAELIIAISILLLLIFIALFFFTVKPIPIPIIQVTEAAVDDKNSINFALGTLKAIETTTAAETRLAAAKTDDFYATQTAQILSITETAIVRDTQAAETIAAQTATAAITQTALQSVLNTQLPITLTGIEIQLTQTAELYTATRAAELTQNAMITVQAQTATRAVEQAELASATAEAQVATQAAALTQTALTLQAQTATRAAEQTEIANVTAVAQTATQAAALTQNSELAATQTTLAALINTQTMETATAAVQATTIVHITETHNAYLAGKILLDDLGIWIDNRANLSQITHTQAQRECASPERLPTRDELRVAADNGITLEEYEWTVDTEVPFIWIAGVSESGHFLQILVGGGLGERPPDEVKGFRCVYPA